MRVVLFSTLQGTYAYVQEEWRMDVSRAMRWGIRVNSQSLRRSVFDGFVEHPRKFEGFVKHLNPHQ